MHICKSRCQKLSIFLVISVSPEPFILQSGLTPQKKRCMQFNGGILHFSGIRTLKGMIICLYCVWRLCFYFLTGKFRTKKKLITACIILGVDVRDLISPKC